MTTRRLVLIRHAKAVSHEGVDVERELAERGIADAMEVGRWLADRGVLPDRIVVSPAVRAGQTWRLAADSAGSTADPVTDDRVYDNTVDALLQIATDTPDEVRTLAIVGHNPSVEDLALALDDGAGDPTARSAMHAKYPTSGVAVFTIHEGWADLVPRTATLSDFAVPRG